MQILRHCEEGAKRLTWQSIKKHQAIPSHLFCKFFFYFTKPKAFATIFLEQARKKVKNLPRWLYRPFGINLVFLFCFGRCGTRYFLFFMKNKK
jgi:hypothetical protein